MAGLPLRQAHLPPQNILYQQPSGVLISQDQPFAHQRRANSYLSPSAPPTNKYANSQQLIYDFDSHHGPVNLDLSHPYLSIPQHNQYSDASDGGS